MAQLEVVMFLYDWPVWVVILMVISVAVALAVGGLALARRFLLPHIEYYYENVNDAISGALGAIGIFYGITLGLIAVEVWQRYSSAENIAASEAAAIYTLYWNVESYYRTVPDPGAKPKNESNTPDKAEPIPAAKKISYYLYNVICVAWEEMRKGERPHEDRDALRAIRSEVESIEPKTEGEKVRYSTMVQSLNDLSEHRRIRVDAADDKLSGRMWTLIIFGAVMIIFTIYLFQIKDAKLHYFMVFLSSSMLSLVILIIVLNNRPFLGNTGIEPSSYTQITFIIMPNKDNPFSSKKPIIHISNNKGWREACDKLNAYLSGASDSTSQTSVP